MKSNALFLVMVVAFGAVPGVHADGMLDPSFGQGGLVVTNFGGFQPSVALSVALQPDGRALASGWTNANLEQTFMSVARYLSSGVLDPSFSEDGKVIVPFAGMPPGFIDVYASAEAVLLQPDGRILLVGGLQVFAGNFFALARLKPDGSTDTSFGVGGRVTTKFAVGGGQPYQGGAFAVAGLLQPDGRIVAVGIATPGSSPMLAAARYNANGRLDHTFGTLGTVVMPMSQPFTASSVALQPDGKLLIGGTYGGDFGVVRLLPDGAPDPSFGGHGLATAEFGGTERGESLVLLPDGGMVLAGDRFTGAWWVSDLAMTRFLADGSLDTSFGTGGLATADAGPYELPGHLVRLPNGKLLQAGYSTSPLTDGIDFLLERFDADGALDTTFGTAGFLRTDFNGKVDECHAAAIVGPDRVLAAGTAGGTWGAGDQALARYILTTQAAEESPEQ